MNCRGQAGSALLETVVFLALASLMFLVITGQLVFMVKVSRGEDARVQAMMAARVKVEELRSGFPSLVFSGESSEYPKTESFELGDFLSVGYGEYTLEKESNRLFEATVRIYDKKGKEVHATRTLVVLGL